jgi:hypothetical protein
MKLREGFHIPGTCSTDARNEAAEGKLGDEIKMQNQRRMHAL